MARQRIEVTDQLEQSRSAATSAAEAAIAAGQAIGKAAKAANA